ncbi:MAG TPA: hypothetical protein PLJ27_16870, partial [Polyangiaceae bacterium]|nr:hypothetical protein [Polyangiaceae bacterium]
MMEYRTADIEDLERVLASAPSPFSDSVLAHALRTPLDVPTIHASLRQHLLGLVGPCAEERQPVFQVITGDPGEGKTHLLAWLRQASEDSLCSTDGQFFALAPIEPLRAFHRIFHHFLHETVRNLSRPLSVSGHLDSAVGSPLAVIVLRALLRIARLVRWAPWTPPDLVETLDKVIPNRPSFFLGAFAEVAACCWGDIERSFVLSAQRLDALAGMDLELFRVIAGFPHPDLRQDLIAWLGGVSLSEQAATRLGTRIILDDEQNAWRGLRLLVDLAALADVPLALAFDQVEGTERLGEEAVAAWLTALGELYNLGGPTVLLMLCQTQTWPRLRQRAPHHVRDRMEARAPIPLLALRPEQAVSLVELRMHRFWRGVGLAPANPAYPFESDALLDLIRSNHLRSPRSILRFMRQWLDDRAGGTHSKPAEPRPIVRSEEIQRRLHAMIEDDRRRPERMPEVREQIVQSALREALTTAWLHGKTVFGARIENVDIPAMRTRSRAGCRITLLLSTKRLRLYFETNNSAHGQSVASATKRMRDMLRDEQADRVMLVRETALPLPPASRNMLQRLYPRSLVFWIDPEMVAPLAAFEQLLNAAATGDVPLAEEEIRRA